MNDQTRRDWVFTIASAAVGLGATRTALPPGVYVASRDHLSHALMSADRYHPIPPGCPTDYIPPPHEPFKPGFFSAREFSVVRRLTGLFLGEPDDSAVIEEVAQWVDLSVSSQAAVQEAESRLTPLHRALATAYFGPDKVGPPANSTSVWREGLEWISAAKLFELESISDERPDKQRENPGTRVFILLKGEIIKGFYTSRVGLKELDFKGNAFYASSPGCRA